MLVQAFDWKGWLPGLAAVFCIHGEHFVLHEHEKEGNERYAGTGACVPSSHGSEGAYSFNVEVTFRPPTGRKAQLRLADSLFGLRLFHCQRQAGFHRRSSIRSGQHQSDAL